MKLFLPLLCAILLPFLVIGQDQSNINDLYIDLPSQDFSTAKFLGLNPSAVSKPTKSTEFAAAIIPNLTKNGLSPGFAVEISPAIFFNSEKADTLKDIIRGYRNWKNASLTIGNGDTSDKGNSLSIGLKYTFWDESDILHNPEAVVNFLEKFQSTTNDAAERSKRVADLVDLFLEPKGLNAELRSDIKDEINENPPKTAFSDRVAVDKWLNSLTKIATLPDALKKSFGDYLFSKKEYIFEIKDLTFISKFKENFAKENWNARIFQVNAGWVGKSKSEKANFVSERFGAYGSFAGRIGGSEWLKKHSQYVFNAYYSSKLGTDSTETAIRTYSEIGGRILFGNYKNRVSIEALFQDKSFANSKYNFQGIRYGIGAEIRVQPGLWLEAGIGGFQYLKSPELGNGSDFAILSGFALRYTLQTERRFKEVN